MNKSLKNLLFQKKGLTLIEVLIVMSLIGIVSLPLMQILFSGQKQFVNHQNTLSEKSRCMVLQEKIRDEILLARTVSLMPEGKSLSLEQEEQDQIALYLKKKDSGYYELIKETIKGSSSSNQQVLLNEDYLKISNLSLNFKLEKDKNVLEVIIKGEDYQIDTAIQLLNFKSDTDAQGQILIYTK